jgi:gluconolactonase
MAAANYPSEFKVHHKSAESLFGPSPALRLICENADYPFAHEAGVFMQENDTLFITSNQYHDPVSGERRIQISKVRLPVRRGESAGSPAVCEEIEAPGVPMANGGVNYKNGVLFCAQGTLQQAGGIVFMESESPYRSHTLISSFHGRDFNSVNDVVVHSDGSIWFTDPIYGFEQGIRPKPRLPSQVYRYEPETGSIRAIADGFGRPNGICFSPDEKTVYITDTDWIHGDGTTDDFRVSNM